MMRAFGSLLLALVPMLMFQSCATIDLWDGPITISAGPSPPDDRLPTPPDGPGDPLPPFIDIPVKILLSPITIAFDIVLFPFQIEGGYRPYNKKSE